MAQYNTSENPQAARLLVAPGETDSNMLWATGMFTPDPFIFFMHGRKKYVVMTDLEFDRARVQATVDVVLKQSEYVRRVQKRGIGFPRTAEVLAEILAEFRIRNVLVPANFPTGLADSLRSARFKVHVKPDPFWPKREIKSEGEIRSISKSLRIAELGMGAGIDALRRTRIGKNGFLYLNGTRLTSEHLKSIINTTIIEHGCVPSHTIVSSGEQSVDPHNEGSGPIQANASVIIDIFPRSEETGYFGDITRTVVRGRASERLKHAFASVNDAQEIGFRRIRSRASAYSIHNEILAHFTKEGFPTGFSNGRMEGFFHGTGHGLGLDVHEAPAFGLRARNRLKKNHVVTVEPGLYYAGMGGVRLEDVVVVSEDGCRNLVRYPKFLEV